jgi:Phage head-tail joining protein
MPDNPTGAIPGSSGIGALRWQVRLYRRDQSPGPNNALSDNFVKLGTVRADIQPIYPSTFYASAQIDTPVTHLIRMRWTDYLDGTHIIGRTTIRPNDGTFRTELFRVRRIKELAGRKRFVEIEVEFERVKTTETDSDAEFEQMFAEGAATVTPFH